MVVTSSRLHAVRYKQAIDALHRRARATPTSRALVAFSGTVDRRRRSTYTEPQHERLPRVADCRASSTTDEYQVLIVAEKYQTGFDQPLLHTMYVDKTLDGRQRRADPVRLNRIHPGKDDTFVLDFRNDAEDIQDAFEPYYERDRRRADRPEPALRPRRALDDFDVLDRDESGALHAGVPRLRASRRNAAALRAARPGRRALRARSTTTSARTFRAALDSVRPRRTRSSPRSSRSPTPSSSSSTSTAASSRCGCRASRPPRLDLSDDVVLTHLRTELTGEHDLSLTEGGGIVAGFTGEGTGGQDPQIAKLSEIIDTLNERFGTEFTEADQVFVDQIEQTCVENEALATQARVNTPENFKLALDKVLEGLVIDRLDANQDFFGRMIDDPAFGSSSATTSRRRSTAGSTSPSSNDPALRSRSARRRPQLTPSPRVLISVLICGC